MPREGAEEAEPPTRAAAGASQAAATAAAAAAATSRREAAPAGALHCAPRSSSRRQAREEPRSPAFGPGPGPMSEPGGSGAAAAGEGGAAAAAAAAAATEPAAAQTEGGSSVGTRASTGSIEKQSNGDEKEILASHSAACMLPTGSACINGNASDVTETPIQKQSNGDEKEILVLPSTTCSLPTCSTDISGNTSDINEALERLKRSQKSMKAEGSDSAASHSLQSEETAAMSEVKVKTEVPDEYVQEVIWQDDAKDSKKNLKEEAGEVPAEICVVIGGVRNQQTLG